MRWTGRFAPVCGPERSRSMPACSSGPAAPSPSAGCCAEKGHGRSALLAAIAIGLVGALVSAGFQGLDALGAPPARLADPVDLVDRHGHELRPHGGRGNPRPCGGRRFAVFRWRQRAHVVACRAVARRCRAVAERPCERRRAAMADAAGGFPARRGDRLLGRRACPAWHRAEARKSAKPCRRSDASPLRSPLSSRCSWRPVRPSPSSRSAGRPR